MHPLSVRSKPVTDSLYMVIHVGTLFAETALGGIACKPSVLDHSTDSINP